MHPWPAIIVYKGKYENISRNNFRLKSTPESSYSQSPVTHTDIYFLRHNKKKRTIGRAKQHYAHAFV